MNYLASVQYIGRNYSGFQLQKNAPTIQGELERALKKIFSKRVVVYSCSRTDSKVNAYDHPINFFASEVETSRLMHGLNSILPNDIKLNYLKTVDNSYSLRYNVKSKTYLYRLFLDGKTPVFITDYVWKCYLKDKDNLVSNLESFCELVIGRHDFRYFTTKEARKVYKTDLVIDDVNFRFKDGILEIRFVGRKFLHKMIRMLVGLMTLYIKNKISSLEIKRLLSGEKVNSFCPVTVPGHGLTLELVILEEEKNE